MATREQALEMLNYANEVRLARSKVLHELNKGTKTLEEVLDNEWCQQATVYNVVRRIHRYGRARTLRALQHAGISETRQVQHLTQRQRAILLTVTDNGKGKADR